MGTAAAGRDTDLAGFNELGMSGSDATYHASSEAELAALRAYGRGIHEPERPLRLHWRFGRGVPSDTVWPDIGTLVASPRFAALLADHTGWRPYAVEVFDKGGSLVPGFVGVAITGRCGPLRCDTERVEGTGMTRQYVGLHFDLATWDGSDLFVAPNMGVIIMSPRLTKAVGKTKITNIHVESLAEMRTFTEFVRKDGYPHQETWA